TLFTGWLTHPRPTHFSLCVPSSSSPSLVTHLHYPRRTPMSTSPTLSTWLSQSISASRSSDLPRPTTPRICHSRYRGRTPTSFERCSKGRPLGSGVYCCRHDESLLDMMHEFLCCLVRQTVLAYNRTLVLVHPYNFEDGYRDSCSRYVRRLLSVLHGLTMSRMW
ncbi:hypothetical protein BDY19DRAFT_979184, partial [Irpex rosettiformis]